jgi:hypothetical protein
MAKQKVQNADITEILKQSGIENQAQLVAHMENRGFNKKTIQGAKRGFKKYGRTPGRKFVFTGENTFKVLDASGQVIQRDGRQLGNNVKDNVADVVGLGNDVSRFMGVVEDLRNSTRQAKADSFVASQGPGGLALKKGSLNTKSNLTVGGVSGINSAGAGDDVLGGQLDPRDISPNRFLSALGNNTGVTSKPSGAAGGGKKTLTKDEQVIQDKANQVHDKTISVAIKSAFQQAREALEGIPGVAAEEGKPDASTVPVEGEPGKPKTKTTTKALEANVGFDKALADFNKAEAYRSKVLAEYADYQAGFRNNSLKGGEGIFDGKSRTDAMIDKLINEVKRDAPTKPASQGELTDLDTRAKKFGFYNYKIGNAKSGFLSAAETKRYKELQKILKK